MTATKAAGWLIVCEGHTVGPLRSAEAAERRLREIEDAGHCRLDHAIVPHLGWRQ